MSTKPRRSPGQVQAAKLAKAVRELPHEDLVYFAREMTRRWQSTAIVLASTLVADPGPDQMSPQLPFEPESDAP